MTASDSIGVAASPKRGKRASQAPEIEAEVAALHRMTVDELRRWYAAVMGEPSRSRRTKRGQSTLFLQRIAPA